jgi:hypothetical protein
VFRWLVLLGMALVVAGCGGNGTTTPSSTGPPAAATTEATATVDPVIGKWKGTGTEIQTTGKARTYPVTMDIAALDPTGTAGRIDYPSFPCGGTVRYAGKHGDAQVFVERITYGVRKCSRGGRIFVTPQGAGLDWRWEGEAGLVVTATLVPA